MTKLSDLRKLCDTANGFTAHVPEGNGVYPVHVPYQTIRQLIDLVELLYERLQIKVGDVAKINGELMSVTKNIKAELDQEAIQAFTAFNQGDKE